MRAKMVLPSAACTALSLNLLTSNVFAASIPIFSTGIDSAGNLARQGDLDPHYAVIADSQSATSAAVLNFTQAFAFISFSNGIPDVWLDNGPESMWIGVPDSAYGIPENINVTFVTTFDLTGFNPATAQIVGGWATDDFGIAISLNGIPLSGLTNLATDFTNLNQLNPFSIDSGFRDGLNTLEFSVVNGPAPGGGPGGFRAQLNGSADIAPVPVPTALPLFIAASLPLITLARPDRRGLVRLAVADLVRGRPAARTGMANRPVPL